MARLRMKKTPGLYAIYQKGGAFSGPVYRGRIHRHAGGFKLPGLGFLVKNVIAKPLANLGKQLGKKIFKTGVKNIGKQIGKRTLKTGANVLWDTVQGVSQGQPIKQSLRRGGKKLLGDVINIGKEEILSGIRQQKGGVIWRRRKYRNRGKGKAKMRGGRLGKLPRETYTTIGRRMTTNVFGD